MEVPVRTVLTVSNEPGSTKVRYLRHFSLAVYSDKVPYFIP